MDRAQILQAEQTCKWTWSALRVVEDTKKQYVWAVNRFGPLMIVSSIKK